MGSWWQPPWKTAAMKCPQSLHDPEKRAEFIFWLVRWTLCDSFSHYLSSLYLLWTNSKQSCPLALFLRHVAWVSPQNLLRIARNVSSLVSSWSAPDEQPQLFLFSLLENIIVSKILLVCDGFNLQTSTGIITLLLHLSRYLEELCH